MNARAPLVVTLLACSLVVACNRQSPETGGGELAGTSQTPATSSGAMSTTTPSDVSARGGVQPSLTVDGDHLVDASGKAVYVLVSDPLGASCNEICEDAWPPVLRPENEAATGEGLQLQMLTEQGRGDGETHLVYNRHALYRYAGDSRAGSTAGHGVQDQWGEWRLMTSAGAPLAGDARQDEAESVPPPDADENSAT